jgi:cytochrome P450
MSNTQDVNTTEHGQQEELPSYPFPFAEHSLERPAIFDRLQKECPVAHVKMPFGGNAYLLMQHADVVKAYTDPRCGMALGSDGDVPRLEAGDVTGNMGDTLFSVSDARHNKVRRLVTQAFTVKHANELRPRVVEVTNKLIDAMEQAGPPADLFEDYAIQTPMTVICELLGIPREDEKLFRDWGRVVLSTTMPLEEKQSRWMMMMQYIIPLIERERAQPRNNVLGLLVKAHEQGEEVITQTEMLTFAAGLIAAGFETVSTTFTNSAFILLQRPDLLEQLKERVDDPEHMASAIEEILRITPIGVGRTRITRSDIEFSGTTLGSGEVLVLTSTAANFDESVFPAAKEIDFDRETNPNVTFGRGIHSCIGQQIARMELQTLWSTLLKRLPTIRLSVAPEEVPWRPDDALTFGPAHLPVTW